MSSPKRRATYEDLMEVPDTKVAEIIDGELIVTPRPASPHAHAATVLGSDVVGSFHGPPGPPPAPGGWWILLEPELHLGNDVLVPDWAGWRRERLPVFPKVAFFTVAPDWVCEIVSPSTGRTDRSAKMRLYAAAGVRHLWIVDPELKILEVYGLDAGHWVVLDVNGASRNPPSAEAQVDGVEGCGASHRVARLLLDSRPSRDRPWRHPARDG